MEIEQNQTSNSQSQPDIAKLAIGSIIGIILLIGLVYAAYEYSRNKSQDIALSPGSTLGSVDENKKKDKTTKNIPSSKTINQPPTAPIRFTVSDDVNWSLYKGKLYPYTFVYPETLPMVIFPGDPNDSVAISWGNIPAQENILLNIEDIEGRSGAYLNKPKIEYVKNWHKFFSGLKGLDRVETFTNSSGLHGYQAIYTNYSDQTPNVDIFFEIPNNPQIMIHVANGILDPNVFNKIVDSVDWTPTEE